MIHPMLWLIGYCELSVSDADAAVFVNIAAATQTGYFERRGVGGGRRSFLVSLRLCGRLMRECKRVGIDVCEMSRHGAPIILLRALRRPGIVIGTAVFFALVLIGEGLLWRIDVIGAERVTADEVCELLEECGMGIGSRISRLDVDKIANRALARSDELSWMSINIVGTVASVEIRESLPPPAPEGPACSNVIAGGNGIIVGFENVRGNLAVSIGDAVAKGDLLIGGVYGAEGEATRFVRAQGSVLALCEREFDISVPFAYSKKVYTGNTKVQKSLIFFKKEVNFFGKCRNSYATCDTIDIVEYFSLFGLGELPIGVRTVTCREYGYVEVHRSEEEALAEAKRLLWQSFEATAGKDAELVSNEMDIEICDGVCRVRARIESIEDIAREQEIEITLYD